MLLLNVRVTVEPDRTEEFEQLARDLAHATVSAEPGCRRYEYVRLEAVGQYGVTMLFDDHEAFLDHQASDHHVRLAGAMRPYIRELVISYAEPLDGAFGLTRPAQFAPLVIDEETRRGYAARFPAPDFSPWSDG